MKKRYFYRYKYYIEALIILSIIYIIAIQPASAEESCSNKISLDFSFTEPEISEVNLSNITYHRVVMNGTLVKESIDLPLLPVKPMKVLIPQNQTLESINVTSSNKTSMGTNYSILLGTSQFSNSSTLYNNETYFNTSTPYPTESLKYLGIQFLRGYSIIIFNINPIFYINNTGEIYYYNNMTVTINTNDSGDIHPLFRNVSQDEILMKQITNNHSFNYTYNETCTLSNSSIVESSESYKYVIITKEKLKDASSSFDQRNWYTFQDLADYKNEQGTTTNIVSVEDIKNDPYYWDTTNPTFNDTQAQIRKFITDVYTNWDTEYILLGGDVDIIPERHIWDRWRDAGGRSRVSDLYYACLDGSYNEDEDERWGEPSDGAPGGDFYQPPRSIETEPNKNKCYAEADSYQVGSEFDVGLFTPCLNLSGVNYFKIEFSTRFNLPMNWAGTGKIISQVRIYSNNISNLEFVKWSKNEQYSGKVKITINLNYVQLDNPNKVYIEFYYRDHNTGWEYHLSSFNIDDLSVKADDEEILWEDFEGDNFPPTDWAQVIYNGDKSWAKEYYRVDVDLLPEVYIGRASVGNKFEVRNFVLKTLAYENTPNNDPFLKKALLVGSWISGEDQNPEKRLWGGDFKDEIIDGSTNYDFSTEGIPSNKYDIDTLYERDWNDNWWKTKDFRKKLNRGVHIMNHMVHGEPFWIVSKKEGKWKIKFATWDINHLINNKYSFIYSMSCNVGQFNYSLNDIPLDCFGEYFTIKTKHGAFAAIMNSGFGYCSPNKPDGSSQKFDREFWDAIYGEEILELGPANQDSKFDNFYLYSDGKSIERVVFFGLNLLGDPQIAIKIPEVNHAPSVPNAEDITYEKNYDGSYTFYVSTTDQNSDKIGYQLRVNGIRYTRWTKYHESGETASITIKLFSGNNNIEVRARDIFLKKSEWSTSKAVQVSFSSNIQIDSTSIVVENIVQFSGMATGGSEPYTSWFYDFGDGNNSQVQNPSHTYGALGAYYVTLNVTDSQSISSNISKIINVVLLNADFESSQGIAVSDEQETFNFNDKSKGYYDIVNWTWDFGDGNISYQRNTSHSYSLEGAYNVSLTITDDQSNNDTAYLIIYVDSVSPTISSVNNNYDIVSYGSNVTIYVNTSDNSCGIKNVKVNITYPDSSYVNCSMIYSSGSIYNYIFYDCWQLGEYSYDVWVADQADNNDSDSTGSFIVSRSFGHSNIGILNQSIWDTITGSFFKVNEKGVADNISVYLDPGNASSDYHYRCVIYNHNTSDLVGISEEKNISAFKDWQTFNFSVPKPVLLNDTEYVIGCWSDNYTVRMYYDNGIGVEGYFNDGNSTLQGHYFEGLYNYTPEQIRFDSEDRKYSIYCSYTPDTTPPEITNVSDTPDTVGFGFNITITADIFENQSGVNIIQVNITYPNSTQYSYDMDHFENDTYNFVFNDTWLKGQYNYSLWTVDYANNSNISTGYSFNVSADATISVCTIKDSYGTNEIVNLTDPPGSSYQVGYELLDIGDVLHIWNNLDHYYFDTDSGIQLTNHYNEYWSHNVLMLGYYNNDEWNLIYRTDELSGFNKEIESDNETYVNATLWKDLNYAGYDFRLAIRYHLGINDNELTVIPYIKNIDNEDIPYNLGFAWEIKDIQIDMTEENDYIDIDGTTYYLNTSGLDETYTDMDIPSFYIKEDTGVDESESLYLRWDENLNYKVQVKSRTGQYNAPVTLGIKIGTLDVGQEKQTELFWHDASEVIYYFNDYDTMFAWATNPANMVDGNTSNYATTTTDRDMEKLDINLESSADKGAISKVEIRAFGKRSGGGMFPPAIILNAVGGLDVFSPTATGNWSSWYDITNKPNAPSPWTWTDIDNLIVEVEASVQPAYTLYCSKVEVRVNYNANPVYSNNYPVSGNNGITITPTLNITVNDQDGDTMNLTWWSNSSGSWQVFGTNNSVTNGTYHQTFTNATVNGQWWYWKVNVSDGTNTVTSNVFSFYTGYQSKIENTGTTNFTGYLLMQIEFYNTTNSTWILEQVVVNETTPRTINVGSTLALDTIFNPNNVSTSSFTNGDGTYRVYAAFRDIYGDVLVCDEETLLEANYQFSVS